MNRVTPSEREVDPRRYFEAVDRQRTDIAQRDPVCLISRRRTAAICHVQRAHGHSRNLSRPPT